MRWECSDCGASLTRSRPPWVCPNCGTAGGRFVSAEEGIEGDPEWESRSESWVHWGMDHPASVAAIDAMLASK